MTPDLDAIEARIAGKRAHDTAPLGMGDYKAWLAFERHAFTDLESLVAEVRSLRDVAEAAEAMLSGLIVDYDAGNTDRQMNDLSAALDAWRAGGGA